MPTDATPSSPGALLPAEPAPFSRAGLAACLFCLSFATVLFTLAIFKLLSFFIMPSLFFDLLFIGFPIGAFIGAAWFPVSQRSFLRSLFVLQAVTAMSVAAVLLAKNLKYFDYLRANLFEVEVHKLLYQMGTFTLLFMPFFAAYGLSEYLGYQLGRRHLAGRMRLVYALYLFGAAAAYLFFRAMVPWMGVSRILGAALVLTAAAILVMSRGKVRLAAAAEILAGCALLSIPGLEPRFLDLYKGSGAQSTREFREGRSPIAGNLPCDLVFQQWGRFSLCEILATPDRKNYYGFYNDFFQWEYSAAMGFSERSLGMIPLLEVKPGSSIAIIGSGGGRQVRFAENIGHRNIVAIEIEPAVFDAVRKPEYLLEQFGRVYENAAVVQPVNREARGYMEASTGRFDLIYLPSVGGYPQMMMEPGNLIRTHEAYKTIQEHLTDDGILAIWYPRGLDGKSILTRQYVQTLRSLGLKTIALQNAYEFLILAYRNPARQFPNAAAVLLMFTQPSDRLRLPPIRPEIDAGIIAGELEVPEDPSFRPITDDQPFLAGNIRHILSVRQVNQLFGICGGVLLAAGLLLLFGLRRRGDPAIPGRSYWQVSGLTLLIGASFLVLEHYLVLALFKRTFVYYDSLMLGAISFLLLSGIGSILATPLWRAAFTAVAAFSIIILIGFPDRLSATLVLALIAPVALATGTFFPQLFDLASRNPLAVFALDAMGAGFGTLLSTFVPILFGFKVLFFAAGGLFLATAAANTLFYRTRLPDGD